MNNSDGYLGGYGGGDSAEYGAVPADADLPRIASAAVPGGAEEYSLPIPDDTGPSISVGLDPSGTPNAALSRADPQAAPASTDLGSIVPPQLQRPATESPPSPGEPSRESMRRLADETPEPPASPATRPAVDIVKSEFRPAGEAGQDGRGRENQSGPQQGQANAGKAVEEERLEEDSEAKPQDAKKEAEKRLRTWRRAKAVPNASRLMIGDHDELPLEGMQANVTIDGFRARVLLDLYFYNDRGRQLEGAFKLRLPNEASLYYFAFGESSFEYRPMVDQLASRGFLAPELIRASGTGPEEIVRVRADTWTKVKEARIVPREKAAHAYSETVRRRVDPALVEWSGAGVFNARVFPLMPGKLHRIVVGYDVNLTQDGDALTYSLDMPEGLSEAHVDLNVAAVPGAEAHVTPATRPFLASGRAYYHLEGPWSEPLVVRINNPETIVLHGQDSQAGRFFATRITPKLPAEETGEASSHAVFLVDTSLSANPDKFNVWLKLLETTLAKNRDTMEQFAVLFFNVESHWWREKYVENNAENVQELLNYCNTLALEGATDLRQALAEATSPSWPEEEKPASQPDVFLLSDGAATWGERNVHLLAETLRSGTGGTLFAYQTGLTGTAVGVLEHLARESGGAVFSVAHEEEIEKAAIAHRQRPWRLLDTAIPGGSDLLVAGRPKSIYPDQTLLIVGRGEPGNEVVLRVARGEDEETIRIPLGEAIESENAARLYGQVAVGQLEDLGAAVEDVAVAYARHFRITGQTCSLLMLESEADYQRFNIRPEDDAFVVKSSAAGAVVSNKLDELGDHLSDPKKALELWLAKMENVPGVQFRLSTAMKLALERLPAEALTVTPPRVVCQEHSREAIPKKYFQQLESGQLEYDAVTEEAARRKEALSAADALKALSSLVENDPGDTTLARDVAFSAIEWGLGGQAYSLLRRVADARPYEPQVYQALAHCAAETGNADLAIVYYEVALGGHWHERYQDLNRIAGVEYMHLLRRINQGELSSHLPDYAKARLESLIEQFGVKRADLVVTMMWNTDRTDVDLHVLEPSGEECYYKNRSTRAGGEITRDVTEGYGPEMYIARDAQHGKYVVKANYYGSDANRTQVRSKVYVTIYEDFGGRKERVTRKTVPLSRNKELREAAEVFIEKR
ncbi:MAG: VWA domain-containing protein, partial [Planctomycetes bacterium]|nr:VWA domain-containing protein [Planctomycetota bacterium]